MSSIKRQARTAAILYFLACLPVPFALVFVPNRLIVPQNATATAEHLRAWPYLVRMGMACELINACVMVFAVVALYRLFRPTSRTLAQSMAALLLLALPISMLNLVNDLAALTFASGAKFLASFTRDQLDALAYMALRVHSQGLYVAQILWGLWLFPYGIVATRSKLVPAIVGVAAMVAGYGYVAYSLAMLFAPRLAPIVGPFAAALEIGEIPIIVWLIWGVREPEGAAALSLKEHSAAAV
jgi:hypothetical protein